MNRTNLLVTFFIALFAIPAFAEHPTSFSQAKRFAREIYQYNQSTFYCGSDIPQILGGIIFDALSEFFEEDASFA
ncbi:hypothetical protein BC355_17045 [Vibrio cholerae]|uniref:Uncharacterized protein n=1 Tax=Vibrio cholerae TaxID=666 RepID=A0A395TFX4_VIBCL|nr:hypothetical protein BC354_17290 [Vibrio cholerae]RGP83507.1 hypothetical protein BC355_17045 [Vibrio cholerae]RGP83595.1 hypothetical protein BC353_17025 [Vibrio cholerae]RGP93295.1 hypothetical protein BC352_16700 [Vibrio cholerae]